jgi:predicted transposase YbfD/YdcC
LSPEEAGLCGCWQWVAVWREQKILRKGKVIKTSSEYAFYCTSAAKEQYTAAQLLQSIRNHWSASENGSHYRRDVSLGEDASTISGRNSAFAMATLRNLVLGLYELQKDRDQTKEAHFAGWRRTLSHAQIIQLITRKI